MDGQDKRTVKLIEKRLQMRQMEEDLYGSGLHHIAGIDEVGRGPLAGPVVAACVVLPKDCSVLGIDDSKKLSEKKRNELSEIIKREAVCFGIGIVEEGVIDDINILNSTKLAMGMAMDEAKKKLEEQGSYIDFVLIDGMALENIETPNRAVIKGDSKCQVIAAASILAKVTRDEMMVRYSEIYHGYGFESNKGYGTKIHYEGLSQMGPCPIHRKTFLRKWYGTK